LRRRSRWYLVSAVLLAAALVALRPPEGGDGIVEAAAASAGSSYRARPMLSRLPQRPGMGEMRNALFTAPVVPPALPAAEPPTVRDAPPNPYRFAGTARFGQSVKILLARGDTLIEAKEGETIDELYEVRSAAPGGVTLVYAPLGIELRVSPAWESTLPPGSPLAPRR
jgi:hypothetical protein